MGRKKYKNAAIYKVLEQINDKYSNESEYWLKEFIKNKNWMIDENYTEEQWEREASSYYDRAQEARIAKLNALARYLNGEEV